MHDEWTFATQLWALDFPTPNVAMPVERALPPINKPMMKLGEVGEVREVVPATMEQPPALTLPADAAATCATGDFATERRGPLRDAGASSTRQGITTEFLARRVSVPVCTTAMTKLILVTTAVTIALSQQ